MDKVKLMNPKTETGYLQKALSVVMSIGLAISGWFLTTAYGELNTLNNRVQAVELIQASTTANRFTSGDFVKAKEIIDQQQLAIDRRITILEENMKNIKDILAEIKADLKALRERQSL